MKTLVVYYSKTGTTKKIAAEIAKKLSADTDEITDLAKRTGVINWLRSCRHSILMKETKIKYSKDPKKYDKIIVGTPVWAGSLVPAVRTYLKKNRLDNKKAVFFCTCGTNEGKAIEQMNIITKAKVQENFVLFGKEIRSGRYKDKIKAFLKK